MSSLMEKLRGECTECEKRKQDMILRWRKLKAEIQAAFDKEHPPNDEDRPNRD